MHDFTGVVITRHYISTCIYTWRELTILPPYLFSLSVLPDHLEDQPSHQFPVSRTKRAPSYSIGSVASARQLILFLRRSCTNRLDSCFRCPFGRPCIDLSVLVLCLSLCRASIFSVMILEGAISRGNYIIHTLPDVVHLLENVNSMYSEMEVKDFP